jgi:hypothetical protein
MEKENLDNGIKPDVSGNEALRVALPINIKGCLIRTKMFLEVTSMIAEKDNRSGTIIMCKTLLKEIDEILIGNDR